MTKAIILAAGEGTRLRPYTLDRPKCMVEIEHQSLLDRHLAVLRSKNIAPIVVIGGYLSETLAGKEVSLKLNPRYAETNMVWTLFCAEEELEGGAIIAYGDIVYSKANLEKLLACNADIAITVDLEWEAYWRARNEDPLLDAETLRMDADKNIIELGKKPQSLTEIEAQYMGLIKLSARGADIFKECFHQARRGGGIAGKPVEKAYMTDLIQAVIDSGNKVQAVPVQGEWIEVDSVSDLELPVTRERLNHIASGL